MRIRICIALCSFLALSGCMSVGSNYVQPEMITPDFSDLLGQEPNDAEVVLDRKNLTNWWENFNDPMLTQLITQAMKESLDVKEIQSRINESRARLGISRADFFPNVDVTGSYIKAKQSGRVFEPISTAGFGSERTVYSESFDASWEIDIFGGKRRQVEAAIADLEAEEASYQNIQVSLAAEIGINYIGLRTTQQRLQVAKTNLESQITTLKILTSRFDSGLADELAVKQAEYNLEYTRSSIPTLLSQLEEIKNNLAVLIGTTPGSLHVTLKELKAIPLASIKVVTDIPTNILRRRPDIQVAERQLAAQSAKIGEAEAELYPKFFLTGSFGYQSLKSANLFSSGSESYSYGPGISWPIFHATAIRNNINVQSEKEKQNLARYEKTVLMAIKEIRDSLMTFSQEQIRLQAFKNAVKAAQSAESLATDKYKSGLTDFNNVLEAQRSMLSLQDELVRSEGQISIDLIRLYKALGGGW